jgi:hypothetical protein
MVIVELLEVIFDITLTLISPERTAEKVKDINISKITKNILITIFTLIYISILVGLIFSLFLIPDTLYRALAIALIIFLVYCLVIFYYKIC